MISTTIASTEVVLVASLLTITASNGPKVMVLFHKKSLK